MRPKEERAMSNEGLPAQQRKNLPLSYVISLFIAIAVGFFLGLLGTVVFALVLFFVV